MYWMTFQCMLVISQPCPVQVSAHVSVRHKDWSMEQVLAEAEGYHSLLKEQTQTLLEQLSKSTASDRISSEIKVIAGMNRQTDSQTDRQTVLCMWCDCGVMLSAVCCSTCWSIWRRSSQLSRKPRCVSVSGPPQG